MLQAHIHKGYVSLAAYFWKSKNVYNREKEEGRNSLKTTDESQVRIWITSEGIELLKSNVYGTDRNSLFFLRASFCRSPLLFLAEETKERKKKTLAYAKGNIIIWEYKDCSTCILFRPNPFQDRSNYFMVGSTVFTFPRSSARLLPR